ncbi:transaldolase [Alkalilimnicola sp. S0819]|uniref:transaldolase n=1 Tax=Alkalilimnicola sp. S0819 TaxID=2613922 RepID=UPI001262AB11|nr:transaldolase [Alkalilimnicola sp. S0819]KAB7628224.1 transaldolase [Alkalilimnicola sp. S0819]MPQ15115.1 transaldolase [Alkalilimnicola sp. S0819]
MSTANPLKKLGEFGQSIWFDNIHRDMLRAGLLAEMIERDGLKGVTSNPTIFEKAITGSAAYDEAIASAVRANPSWDSEALFNHLAVEDIRAGADELRGVHEASAGRDGFISIEVSPRLARDAAGTVAEGLRLHAWIDRPNVMIKVPATTEGLEAIEALTREGISVNVTLLFAVSRYEEVVEAWLRGLEARHAAGKPLAHIASVASFFVSRVDSAVDKALDELGVQDFQGRAAIANARAAYRHFQQAFSGERWEALEAAGAQLQRLLWASTGTKNPAYSDVLYVEELIGEHTVNTVPPATYEAYRDHGEPAARLAEDLDEPARILATLRGYGVDLAAITETLERDGIQAFVDSYDNLLRALEDKAARLLSDRQAAG